MLGLLIAIVYSNLAFHTDRKFTMCYMKGSIFLGIFTRSTVILTSYIQELSAKDHTVDHTLLVDTQYKVHAIDQKAFDNHNAKYTVHTESLWSHHLQLVPFVLLPHRIAPGLTHTTLHEIEIQGCSFAH